MPIISTTTNNSINVNALLKAGGGGDITGNKMFIHGGLLFKPCGISRTV